MKKIEDYLVQLGLCPIEARLYYGLLKIGPSTVKDLAEAVSLNRVTTHFQINELIKKGLVVQIKNGSRRQIVSEPPNRLGYLVEQQEKEAKELRDEYPDFLKTIEHTFTKNVGNEEVEVKLYKGKQGVRLIYQDVLQAKELRTYVNSKEAMRIFPENLQLFVNAHNNREDMEIWEIMNRSTVLEAKKYTDRMVKERYHVKYVPERMNLSIIDNLIYDGKVAIVNITENPTGMIIINKDYYESARAIFDFVWRMLPATS